MPLGSDRAPNHGRRTVTTAERDEQAYQHALRWAKSAQSGQPLPLPPHPIQSRMWQAFTPLGKSEVAKRNAAT